MKKKAIVISNPGETGSPGYCQGVNVDVTNYKRFLDGPYGGWWLTSEVQHLSRPSAAEVREVMKQLSNCDYALVVFTGHGYYSAQRRSTILKLRADQEIDSAELMNGSPKQTVILDCCREVEKEKAIFEDAMLKAARAAAYPVNGQRCRAAYEQTIEACSKGLIVVHSCNVGETAQDSSSEGGYYSAALLKTSLKWGETQSSASTLLMPTAHDIAAPSVVRQSGNRQHPQIDKPRTERQFPFAVVA